MTRPCNRNLCHDAALSSKQQYLPAWVGPSKKSYAPADGHNADGLPCEQLGCQAAQGCSAAKVSNAAPRFSLAQPRAPGQPAHAPLRPGRGRGFVVKLPRACLDRIAARRLTIRIASFLCVSSLPLLASACGGGAAIAAAEDGHCPHSGRARSVACHACMSAGSKEQALLLLGENKQGSRGKARLAGGYAHARHAFGVGIPETYINASCGQQHSQHTTELEGQEMSTNSTHARDGSHRTPTSTSGPNASRANASSPPRGSIFWAMARSRDVQHALTARATGANAPPRGSKTFVLRPGVPPF